MSGPCAYCDDGWPVLHSIAPNGRRRHGYPENYKGLRAGYPICLDEPAAPEPPEAGEARRAYDEQLEQHIRDGSWEAARPHPEGEAGRQPKTVDSSDIIRNALTLPEGEAGTAEAQRVLDQVTAAMAYGQEHEAVRVVSAALRTAQAEAYEEAANLVERKHSEGDTGIVAGLLRDRAARARSQL